MTSRVIDVALEFKMSDFYFAFHSDVKLSLNGWFEKIQNPNTNLIWGDRKLKGGSAQLTSKKDKKAAIWTLWQLDSGLVFPLTLFESAICSNFTDVAKFDLKSLTARFD